jgi:FlaA1/EpsC-like NDP-sugar epimerase
MSVNITKQIILNFPRPVKRGIVICVDILFCLFSVWLAFGLRMDQWHLLQGTQWWVLVVSIGISLPLFIVFGLYRAIFRYMGSAALVSIVRVFVIYSGIFFCLFTIVGVQGVPRSIGVIQPILLFISVSASRYFIRHWLGGITNVQKMLRHDKSTALVYGAGSAGRQLVAGLAVNKEILVKGFVDDDLHLHGNTINGVPVYASDNLKDLALQLEVTDVFLAIPSATQDRRNQIIASLEGCGVRVRTLPGIIDIASGRLRISDLHDLDMNDLLGRNVVPPDIELLNKNISGKEILVTGAGGSIGSELCRQIIKYSPRILILVESSEHSLYLLYEELKKLISIQDQNNIEPHASQNNLALSSKDNIKLVPCLASVRDKDLVRKIFDSYKPKTVFHAAAYKHVPLVEQNPAEGIRNNVLGTLNCAQASLEVGVTHFILVSTDKAVRPTNVMGASKRIAEMLLQALADKNSNGETRFSMVRFGNVLGSSGSVAPLFSAQIKAGGPITLTHPEVTRYFMTIPEAAQLVIQAGAMGVGGDVFVLDMGQPVRIYDLATRMIYLSGLMLKDGNNPNGDIEIETTGLRPGEKLYEELLIGEHSQPTEHPKIMKAHENFLPWNILQLELEELEKALSSENTDLIRDILKKLVVGYQPSFSE